MTDTLVRLLNSYGYQPFRIAKTRLKPPEVFTFDRNRLVRWGPLSDFIIGRINNNISLTHGQLPDIEHKYTSKKSTSAAISFLENVLRSIGISSIPKLDLSFCSGKNLVFSFTGIEYLTLDPSRLAPYLDRFNSAHIPKRLIDSGRLHVSYEYLFANKILMQSADFLSFENISVSNLSEYIKLGADGKVSLENHTTLAFSSDQNHSAAFAYKSGRLIPKEAGWEFFPIDSLLGSEPAGKGRSYIPARGVVLEAENTNQRS